MGVGLFTKKLRTHLFKLALNDNNLVFYYTEFILSIYLGIFIIHFTSYYS